MWHVGAHTCNGRLKRMQLHAPCAKTSATKPWQQPSAHMWMSGATLSHEKGGHTCRVSALVVVAVGALEVLPPAHDGSTGCSYLQQTKHRSAGGGLTC